MPMVNVSPNNVMLIRYHHVSCILTSLQCGVNVMPICTPISVQRFAFKTSWLKCANLSNESFCVVVDGRTIFETQTQSGKHLIKLLTFPLPEIDHTAARVKNHTIWENVYWDHANFQPSR